MDIRETGGASGEYGSTGNTGGTGSASRPVGVALVSKGTSSGDPYAPMLSSLGSTATGAAVRPIPPRRVPAEGRGRASRKAAREVHWAFAKCRESLEASAASYDDFAARMNALYDAGEALERVWEAAGDREDELKEIVNVLQALLLDKKPETYSLDQIKTVAWSASRTVAENPVRSDTVVEILQELERRGLAPFDMLD